MKKPISFLCLFTLFVFVSSGAILNNLPVTFSMLGSTNYSPDSGGQQSGYILNLGYVGLTWLGVQFVNTGGNSDFVVLQASDFYTTDGSALNTGHQVTYSDYYSVSRSSGLTADSITTYDASSYTYSQTKSYSLQIKRYVGSNNGQDWDGNANKYSVQQICFYSSDLTFDAATFNNYYSACYYYEINNYISTFVGEYLKSFMLNGYNTSIFGYIDGPIATSKVYLYQQTQLLGYSTPPAGIIEIGTTAGKFGQDYYAYSPISSESGDYYGDSITQMNFDNTAKGFQNPALTINHWNANPATQITGLSFTALRISFSRAVYTYDDYDKPMLSTFLFCFYLFASGSINGALSDKACEAVELSPVYLQMGLAVPVWQQRLFFMLSLAILVMMCMF